MVVPIIYEFPDINNFQSIYIHKHALMGIFEMLYRLKTWHERKVTIKNILKSEYYLKISMYACLASAIIRLLSLLLWFGGFLFPFVILPAHDWVVQHVHAVGEDVSVVSYIAGSEW